MILNYSKNTFKSTIRDTRINDETFFAFIDNHTTTTESIHKPVRRKYIQFYFCTKGQTVLNFNKGSYRLTIEKGLSFLLYNPSSELPIHLNIHKKSNVFIILITLDYFHSLFSQSKDVIPFLMNENINQKFYKEYPISPSILDVLDKLSHYSLGPDFESVYFQGKILELFVLFFHNSQKKQTNSCPFLENEEIMLKIKQAKDSLVNNLHDPPTIQSLSSELDISPYKLKEGFKKVYGTTLFSYLLNYKLEKGKDLLTNQRMSVQETAFALGYENPSHFINAFKKKYGKTPKKIQ